MTYRLRNIGIAIALAVVAALLTTFYVTNYKRSVQHGESKVPVYVATRDIALGTSGSDVASGGMLKVEQVPRRSVVPGAISQPDQIQKLVAVDKIYAGEQVSTNRFRPVQEQGVQAQLKGNLRAIQVPGTGPQLLNGTLKDGDRVDIVANISVDNGSSEQHATRIVLRDIDVLHVNQTSAPTSPNQANSVILAVTDTQVQRLFYVMKNDDWTLELRPAVNAADSSERVDTLNTILTAGVK
jgi:Flp pilus assembly protein CpaB